MAFKLDKNAFKWIMIAMVAIFVVMAGLLVFHFAGGLSLFQPEPTPTPSPDGTPAEETGPWGQKSFSWQYNGITHAANVYITKDIYKKYQYGISGTICPEDLPDYIVTYGDGGVVSDLAGQMKNIILRQGYTSDADIVGLVLAFSESITYQTDSETGHSSAYPRTPVVTLAEQTGDSADHAILAAAVLEELGYGCALLYYPSTYDRLSLIPDATALGLISDDDSSRPVYTAVLENITTFSVAPFWAVDTNSQGFPTAAYNGITPQILTSESFWTGKHYTPTDGEYPGLNITSTLLIKDSNNLTFTPRNWQKDVADYYADSWYKTGISWSMNDKWQLYQQFVKVADVPTTLYTPWGTAVHNATVPWRMVYEITGMDDDHSDKEMTPYSDVRIAVYSYNEKTDSAELIKVFGWQGLYGADKYRMVGPFSPGNYAIAVFVRNAGVDISLEYHGKSGTPSYTGGI
ncbi:hypothetical protein [Methanorbis rubei]|uniref:Transglutaminase-like domain-containing protein n=1 Tax=Methanorbis rubei TaxID=3028300 RepID=A0AAE4MFS9_9EURY|nr:hypothetical protein [Methanocorpusculaceae archaeon Cs1]